ncbi:H(+)/Cl(-) exchange transporter 3 [Triplophysa tibetana]|uniref:H(+)/Cl(-) exchange transporter 3 n=1 Tax=Triplophysa tibetana TaxID=1572043 RepID=A0A5A9PMC6_9TELE|nr:H(+)/Cl(-) exchange transporter 3 [Triplophysa tibetana]
MESEQLFNRGYGRNSYNSITSASSDEELLDGAGVIMDFHTTEDDNLLDGDASPVFHFVSDFLSLSSNLVVMVVPGAAYLQVYCFQ